MPTLVLIDQRRIIKMPRTFEEAQALVVSNLEKRVPESGMEAIWKQHLIGSANAMTEVSMHAALAREKIGSLDNEKQVASDIHVLMQ